MAEQDDNKAEQRQDQPKRGGFKPGQSGNPKGRPRKVQPPPGPAPAPRTDPWQQRVDTWYGATTGIGNSQYDKRMGHFAVVPQITYQQVVDAWRSDDMIAKAIEVVPAECDREGLELVIPGEQSEQAEGDKERVEQLLRDVEARVAMRRAHELDRALGGAAIQLGVTDGQGMEAPLDLKRITKFDFLNVLEPIEIIPFKYYADPFGKNYGKPELYQVAQLAQGTASTSMQIIHESRLIVFPGRTVSRYQTCNTIAGSTWGDSVLTRVMEIVRDFSLAAAAAGLIVCDFSQPVIKIEGYADLVAAEGRTVLAERMAALELTRSVARALLLDTNESYERQTVSVAGLRELLDWMSSRVASALKCPLTKLMGQSPKGLGNEGESDLRFWYDEIAQEQIDKLENPWRRVHQVAFAALKIPEPRNWSIKFHPLWQQSAAEIAARNKTQAEADAIYLDQGVLSQREVRESRFRGEWSPETQLDDDAWEEEQAKALEQAAMIAGGAAEPGAAPGAPTKPEPPDDDPEDPDPEETADDEALEDFNPNHGTHGYFAAGSGGGGSGGESGSGGGEGGGAGKPLTPAMVKTLAVIKGIPEGVPRIRNWTKGVTMPALEGLIARGNVVRGADQPIKYHGKQNANKPPEMMHHYVWAKDSE